MRYVCILGHSRSQSNLLVSKLQPASFDYKMRKINALPIMLTVYSRVFGSESFAMLVLFTNLLKVPSNSN